MLRNAAGQRRIIGHDCGDHHKCQACAEKRARAIRARLQRALDRLESGPWSRRVGYFLTFTLSRTEASAYGQAGRDRLAKAVNAFNASLRKRLGSAIRVLLKLRVYEFQQDGAFHAHMVLVLSESVDVKGLLKAQYHEGFCDCVTVPAGDVGARAGYVLKALSYSIKGGYVPPRFRVAASRMYAMSGWAVEKRRRVPSHRGYVVEQVTVMENGSAPRNRRLYIPWRLQSWKTSIPLLGRGFVAASLVLSELGFSSSSGLTSSGRKFLQSCPASLGTSFFPVLQTPCPASLRKGLCS